MASPSPRQIISAVRAFARRHEIFRPGPIVLAVSGGTDSTALALIAAELREEFGLVLHVAHFDHRTRPRDAAKDAQFVAEIANHIGAPIRVGRAQRAPKSEDDAREQRYAFLRRVAREIGATTIATGHTIDDQAETVLLHLTRGSGLAGVAGMRPLRDGIARPLLAIGRAETTAICKATKIKPREDPSNRSLRFARNRIRRNVIPELGRINPRVREALARFAEAATEADAQLNANADVENVVRAADAAIDDTATTKALDVRRLPSDAAARGSALVRWWRTQTGRTLTARNRAALAALASSTAGTRRLDLPGGSAVREYARLNFVARQAVANEEERTPQRLAKGSGVHWHGWRINLDMAADGLPFTARVDDATAANLVVRARRPGDRVLKRGKLQDVFVDAKVPERQRDRWPLLTVEQDVIWVPGVTPSPESGDVVIAAGPAGTGRTAGEDQVGNQTRKRRVASMSEARRKGGNRGPR